MALNMGEGNGTARTHQLADKQDGHQQMDSQLEGEDSTPLLSRIEVLEVVVSLIPRPHLYWSGTRLLDEVDQPCLNVAKSWNCKTVPSLWATR